MTRKRKILLSIAAALVLLLIAVAVGLLWVLQSDWLREKVRLRIISTVEDATGGRVELKDFKYNWRALTAEVDGFVIHGTESVAEPPLMSAARVEVGLKIISLAKRDIDLASLIVDRPMIYLIIHEDGSTNIPEPKLKRPPNQEPALQQLLDLKIKHLEIDHGIVEANMKETPLDIRADNLNAQLNYDQNGPRYGTRISADLLWFRTEDVEPMSGSLAVQASIERDLIRFDSFTYQLKKSRVTATGTLTHLADPQLQLNTKIDIDLVEGGKIVELHEFRAGQLRFVGTAKYDAQGFLLSGHAEADRIRYQEPTFVIPNGRLSGDLELGTTFVSVKRLKMAAFGATMTGSAELKHYHHLLMDVNVTGLDTAEVGPLLLRDQLPWHGIGSGPVHLKVDFSKHSKVNVEAKLSIVPGTKGIPVDGELDFAYQWRPEIIEIKNATLHFPHSTLQVAGQVDRELGVTFDTQSLDDLKPALDIAGSGGEPIVLPAQLALGGNAHFSGSVTGRLWNPVIDGQISANHAILQGETIDSLNSKLLVRDDHLEVTSIVASQGPMRLSAQGSMNFENWSPRKSSPLKLEGKIEGADLDELAKNFGGKSMPPIRGIATASFQIHGSAADPQGKAHVDVTRLVAMDEHIADLRLDAQLQGNRLDISKAAAGEGSSVLTMDGHYVHAPDDWTTGDATLHVETHAFRFTDSGSLHQLDSTLNGKADLDLVAQGHLQHSELDLDAINGKAALRDVVIDQVEYGSLHLEAQTKNKVLNGVFGVDLHDTQISGDLNVGLNKQYPLTGHASIAHVGFSTINAFLGPGRKPLPFDGFLKNGNLAFQGSLLKPREIGGRLTLETFELDPKIPISAGGGLKPGDVVFKNQDPIVLEYSGGRVRLQPAHFSARDTSLSIGGTVPVLDKGPVNATVDGSLNLKVFQLFDKNVVSDGLSTVRVNIGGSLSDPTITGTLELKDAGFHLSSFSNGLEHADGIIRFDQNRATIQKLTARSGGGQLSVLGFVTFGQGGPLVYRLEGRATDVRVRYAGVLSVTSTAALKFTGTSESSLLSGTVTVNKATFGASADIGALFASTAGPVAAPTEESDFLRGVQLDIRVESAPAFQLSTSLSQDVQAEIDLRLRGSPNLPSVLGRISVNEGQVNVFGNKYSINRGEIGFYNPSKIEPVLDVDLETEVRAITVNITISGIPSKLNVNYRSDPPLQPNEIIALLAVGRTPAPVSSLANAQIETSAFTSGANTVLGQALSPATDRLQKLFGVTHIKIDPLVQGIDNSTQTRLTLEQQVSKEITVTYVANLSHTSEQIFRFEWTVSTQVSVVALRDENGNFGIDLLFKKRYK